MTPILSSSYRLDRRWPRVSKRWAYVLEHSDLTLPTARALVRDAKHHEPHGLQQRIVRAVERVVCVSKSHRATRAQVVAYRFAQTP